MPEHNNGSPPSEGDRTLSDLYRQTRDEPLNTASLDQKILSAARQELAGQLPEEGYQPPADSSNVVRFSGWRRWSPPIASAACLLLGVSLVFNIVLYQQAGNQLLPAADFQASQPLQADYAAPKEKADAVIEQPPARLESRERQAAKLRSRPAPEPSADAPRSLSAAEADDVFQEFQEIVVTAAKREQTQSLTPELEQRIEGIIALLEDGDLSGASQQLALLLDQLAEEPGETQ